jgi:ribosomal protein S18 acetylase RimI-like enzyme
MAACPPRQLVIRTARTEDLPAVAHLLDQAGEWMRQQGITDQWPIRFPLSDLAQRVDRGELHIAHDDAIPVGTFALDHHADPEFWHDDPNGDHAGYLHRLAVDRAHAGHGIGAQLVDHAAGVVARGGRQWLRLDCAKHNTRLHDYYRRLGFTHLRTVELSHRKSGALFQRHVALGEPRPAGCRHQTPKHYASSKNAPPNA